MSDEAKSGDGSSESVQRQICEVPDCGNDAISDSTGPATGRNLCGLHRAQELLASRQANAQVNPQMLPYMESARTAMVLLSEEARRIESLQSGLETAFNSMDDLLNRWKSATVQSLTTRQEAVQTCIDNHHAIKRYEAAVEAAYAAGDLAEVSRLSRAMQESTPEILAQFERARLLREQEGPALASRLGQLRRLHGMMSNQAAAFGRGPVAAASHEIPVDDRVDWVAVYSNTADFRADPSGRVVVPVDEAGDAGLVQLPDPCLVARVRCKDHLTVLSVDGSVRLRSYWDPVNWEEPVCGLYCQRQLGDSGCQLLYLAQRTVITVADLSGRVSRRISVDSVPGFDCFRGIGGSLEAGIFVTFTNKIARLCRNTEDDVVDPQLPPPAPSVIELAEYPDAELRGLAVVDSDSLLVTDMRLGRVHRVRHSQSSTPSTVTSASASDSTSDSATTPRPLEFERPLDVAVDSRGRAFVSESGASLVRALRAADCTAAGAGLGADGTIGFPCGLAIVPAALGDPERLVVADLAMKCLLVYNMMG